MTMLTVLTNLNRPHLPNWLWVVCGILIAVMLVFPLIRAWNRKQTMKRIRAIAPQLAEAEAAAAAADIADILGTTGVMAEQQPGVYY